MSDDSHSEKENSLFRQAMTGVKPLKTRGMKVSKTNLSVSPSPKRTEQNIDQDDLQANLSLSDTVLTPVDAETKLSFHRISLATKQFKQLQLGQIRYERKLDLHGLRSQAAKHRLLTCLNEAKRHRQRCILVIHGKGGHDFEPPKLKNLVNVWLKQCPDVLAFHSALAKDGGAGAVYVLLKR